MKPALLLFVCVVFLDDVVARSEPSTTGPGSDSMSTTRFPGDDHHVTIQVVGGNGKVPANLVVKIGGVAGYRPNADGVITLPVDPRLPQVDVEITAPGFETVKKRVFNKSPHQSLVVPLNRVEPEEDSTH